MFVPGCGQLKICCVTREPICTVDRHLQSDNGRMKVMRSGGLSAG